MTHGMDSKRSKKQPKPRANPPVRDGRRITFQVDNQLADDIRQLADEKFKKHPKKGRLSSLMREAVEPYVAKLKAERE